MANRRGRIHLPREHRTESVTPASTTLNSEIMIEPERDTETQLTPVEATTDAETSKRVRGRTYGKGARKAMKSAKDRLKVEFDFKVLKAVCNNAEAFNNEIGYIMRKRCSLRYKEWRYVPEEDRRRLRERLLRLFDINIENGEVRQLIDTQMQKAWRSFKYKLHKHFKAIGGDDDLIKAEAEGHLEVKKEDWEFLCDYWANDKFKERSKKNAESRDKRKWETRNGSKSTVRHHLAHGRELDGKTGHIEAWENLNYHPERGWSTPELQAKHEEMMKLREENSPENMTDKENLEIVLGRQSNRLSGWGRSPSKSKTSCGGSSSCSTHTQAADELKVVKAELEGLKDDFVKMQQLLVEREILPHSSLPRAPSELNSGPSTTASSRDYFSDSDDLC